MIDLKLYFNLLRNNLFSLKLKKILNFDDKHDKEMLNYEMIADSNEIIKKLEQIKFKPFIKILGHFATPIKI